MKFISHRPVGEATTMMALQKGHGGHIMDFDLYSETRKNNGNSIQASQRGKENKMWVTIEGSNTLSPDFQFHQKGHGNEIRGFGEGTRFYYEGDAAEQFNISQRGRMNVIEGEIHDGDAIDLSIDQRGRTNYTKVDSWGWNHLVDVTQRCGKNNQAEIYQRSGTQGHSATVFQKGSNNVADVHQTL